WTGFVVVPAAGTWTFGTNSDDGSEILIDLNNNGVFESTERVVNNNGSHGATIVIGNAVFPAAGNYRIAIPYFQGTGGGTMEARFSSAGGGVAYASQTVIDPSSAAQAGRWLSETSVANQLTERGYN